MHNPHPLRNAAYFGDAARSLFGWYHSAEMGMRRDCVAVICAPIGHEYTQSHRTVRHLADRLAMHGIPALRFDYHGTGDSPGTDFDPDRLSRWRSDIVAAVAHAKALSGCNSVCLVGMRLGAMLAAFAAAECEVELLVMWNPIANGRAYLRERQAIAMAAQRTAERVDGMLESAGYIVTAETIAALQKSELAETPLHVSRRILLLSRDDQAPDAALLRHLESSGIAFDRERAPGWVDMMVEEHNTVVPETALGVLVDWVVGNSLPAVERPAELASPDSRVARTELNIPWDEGKGTGNDIEERLCRFGSDDHLFGILSRASDYRGRPAIIMFNPGSVHHVGPHRLYVTLSRSLAAQGFACFRFDLEGLGDSVRRDERRENHPYPDWALADARAALGFLVKRFGYERFIVIGLCAGAHTAFHAAVSVVEYGIEEMIAINPLTFRWKEGQFLDFNWYRGAMTDSRKWGRLLRGEIKMRRVIAVLWGHLASTIRSRFDFMREVLLPDKGPQLSQDLRKLFALKRKVTFFIAEGDPGIEILKAGARYTATKALRSGRIGLEMIPDADHTFSQLSARKVLIERLRAHVAPTLAKTAR